jgi:hydrogenase expression/formation protein HypC
MCVGTIARLTESWEEDGVRLGRLDNGSEVTLSFVPDASPGVYVLVHLGIPVEVLDSATAEEALALRGESP